MRKYVVLAVLAVAVWWMHRDTTAEAVVHTGAPVAPHVIAEPHHIMLPTPRPELPPPALPDVPDDGHVLLGHVASPDGVDLAGAHVIVHADGFSRGALTDVEGNFHIDGLAAGDYEVVYFYGSSGTTGTVTVGAGNQSISATVDPLVDAPSRILEWQEVEVDGLPSPYSYKEPAHIDYEIYL